MSADSFWFSVTYTASCYSFAALPIVTRFSCVVRLCYY